MISTEEEHLQREAALFGRYLIGQEPALELATRYAQANGVLRLEAAHTAKEVAVVAFCRRHPLALPALDAAAGWLAPESLLRHKILTMAAILETTPEHAREFFGRPATPVGFFLRTSLLATRAVALTLVGSILHLAIRGRREPSSP